MQLLANYLWIIRSNLPWRCIYCRWSVNYNRFLVNILN